MIFLFLGRMKRLLGNLNEKNEKFKKAVKYYKEAYKIF